MHLHSKYSDGLNTPMEMIEAAISVGIQKMCFTDHVWRSSEWIHEYADEILRLRNLYSDKIEILCGVEAKLLDCEGNLDVPDEVLSKNLRVVGAMHRIPLGDGFFLRRSEISNHDKDYVRAVWFKAFQSFKLNKSLSCIAHPFSLFAVMGITCEDTQWWELISKEVSLLPCMIEYNVKYDNTVVPEWFWQFHADKIVMGSDSHSVEDIQNRIKELKFISERIEAYRR